MIQVALKQQLISVKNLLAKITDEQYRNSIVHLGNASIGGHTRHIIELVQCLHKGYENGLVNYVNRNRDLNLESNRMMAILELERLESTDLRPNKTLNLYIETEQNSLETQVTTTYYRELVYNTEHCIHHLALIKVALLEMGLQLVDESFGMAYSTLKYKASFTQNN